MSASVVNVDKVETNNVEADNDEPLDLSFKTLTEENHNPAGNLQEDFSKSFQYCILTRFNEITNRPKNGPGTATIYHTHTP